MSHRSTPFIPKRVRRPAGSPDELFWHGAHESIHLHGAFIPSIEGIASMRGPSSADQRPTFTAAARA